ncbi:TetR/AcrR family transcriptional regulator [Larkinella soli]|uniref:TetR/AcrR family transcriptional regulator n=1 Tax=Larkinella soli TaxID=1770527 RepID=UPI000FFBAFA7|nr:TetR/AcrR family transcriptional regulator [Larkinella soli]
MERILQAVGEVIAERGAERAGINAVAEKAGVNKVLIYRYFGGWEGLMEQFLKEGHFLTTYNEQFLAGLTGLKTESPNEVWVQYLTGLMKELRERKPVQELLKWEISNPTSSLSQRLAVVRNESYRKVVEQLVQDRREEIDPVVALLVSGITLLLLIGPSHGKIMNVDLSGDEGWQRIECAIRRIIAGLPEAGN